MIPLEAVARQARSLEQVEHRPWPLPAGRWAAARTYEDVLFAHWRVRAAELRGHVPSTLELETHDGAAWLGVTVSRVSAQRARGLLPLPGSFLELQVRTYVTSGERPGIWLLSVDASSRLAVEAARRALGLPSFDARMSASREGRSTAYECARSGEPGRVFSARFRPKGHEFHPAAGSLESFLTERYCVYAIDRRGRVRRAELHHRPWALHFADAAIELASIAPVGLHGEPLCHVAGRQDVLIWPLEPVR